MGVCCITALLCHPCFFSCRIRVCALVGLQSTITFNYWSYTNTLIPAVNIAVSAPQGAAAGVIATLQDTQQASTPMAGSFTLAIGEYCDTVQVAVGETPEGLQAKVESLPSVPAGVEVTASGSVHDSLAYTITFPSSAGDVPSLRVASSDITGSQPSVSTTTLQKGSTDMFYGPIPAELLRVPSATNKGIQLHIDGVPSACGMTFEGTNELVPGSTVPANASAACSFEATASATPMLSSVVPNGTIAPLNILVSAEYHA